MTTTLKFYYNGIKDNGGKLQTCHYGISSHNGTIHINARGWLSFSAGICAAFKVRNNSEVMTDFFDKDHIDVQLDHPLYNDVLIAFRKAQEKSAERQTAYLTRINAKLDAITNKQGATK